MAESGMSTARSVKCTTSSKMRDPAFAKEMKAKSANANVKQPKWPTKSVYLCGGRKNEEGLEATESSVGTDMLLITFATT